MQRHYQMQKVRRRRLFEVEEILDDTGSRKEGTKQYLVKWAGYGAEDNS